MRCERCAPFYTFDFSSYSEFPFWIGKNRFTRASQEHRHHYVQIVSVIRGKGWHYFNNKRCEISAGDIFIVPPFVFHKIWPCEENGKVEAIEIEFLPEFLNEQFCGFRTSSEIWKARNLFDFDYVSMFLLNKDEMPGKIVLSEQAKQKLVRIVDEMQCEYAEKSELFEHGFKALLLELLVLLSREFHSSDGADGRRDVLLEHRTAIQKVLNYIDENYREEMRIEDMTKIAMMSQTYFCYFFKLLVGKTFNRYLIEKRLDLAKELLKNTELSVTQIAMQAGFNSTSHFIRTFKVNINLSPSQFRNIAKTIEKTKEE